MSTTIIYFHGFGAIISQTEVLPLSLFVELRTTTHCLDIYKLVQMDNDDRKLVYKSLSVYRYQFRICYTIIPSIICTLMVISLVAFIYCVHAVDKYKMSPQSPYFTVVIVTSFFSSLSSGYLILVMCLRKNTPCDWNTICDKPTELIVWRLDGDEWTQYLESMLPANSWAKYFVERSPRFCWHRKFARLSARGYGFIVFIKKALIVDELFICQLAASTVNCCHLITYPNQQLALRMYIRPDPLYMRSDQAGDLHMIAQHIDLFIPKVFHEPRQRLEQMVKLINTEPDFVGDRFHNFQQIHALFEPIKV